MKRSLNVPDSLVKAATTKRRSTDPVISGVPASRAPRAKRGKIAVYMDTDQLARVRGCYAALPAGRRPPSLSQWIAGLILDEVEKIEEVYESAPLESGRLRKGAPFKS